MNEYEKLCNEYRENKRLIEELTAENDAIKEQLIRALQGEKTKTFGASKVTYTHFEQTRLDGAALKKALPDVYSTYTKTTLATRFNIA